MIYDRLLLPVIEKRLARRSAVVLLGPRQVGKTTLARAVAAMRIMPTLYLDLERPADQIRLADADAFLRGISEGLVVLDEVQRRPDLFPILRGVIDDQILRDAPVRFLLLGSAALDLSRQASESLAGRVSYLELFPLGLQEVRSHDVSAETLWLRGGFPQSLRAADDGESFEWRGDFIKSYLERDVPMFAPRLPAEVIGRLWTMLAHGQGSTLAVSRLASSLAVSATSVARYIDLLCDLLLARRLPPWSGNVGKRLTRSPKVYVRDSGLVHALLGIDSMYHLLGHAVNGASWEGFVIENCLAAAGERRSASFYRTEDGAEVDLVFERDGEVEMAIEIKRSTAPVLSKGFRSACAVLRPKERYCIHGGNDQWPMPDGVTAISLGAMLDRLSS